MASDTTVATEQDRRHMRRALELAERGRGSVSPNPMVGAVIVAPDRRPRPRRGLPRRARRIFTPRPRRSPTPRAREADVAGATIYVTLEPCAHQGRQPPCTDAIVAAGIGRVVIASDDPTEKASGRGPGILRDEGDRGRDHRRRRGRRRATAQPALPQARADRPPVRRAQVGGDPRWPHRHRQRRLEVDLRRHQPRVGPPLAGGDGRRRGRRRDGDHRRRALDRTRRRHGPPAEPGRLRLQRPPATRLAPRPHGYRGARNRDRRPGGGRDRDRRADQPRCRGDRRAPARGPTGSTPRSTSSAGATITSVLLEGGATLAGSFARRRRARRVAAVHRAAAARRRRLAAAARGRGRRLATPTPTGRWPWSGSAPATICWSGPG